MHEPPSATLPVIVGIGASAGGLDALKRFFAAVPAGTDLSFVVVMHLDPSRKSMLDEILARTTRLNVCHAEEGMAPEPETVYIAPPRQEITIRDSLLHLEEPQAPENMYHLIDIFFDSLAAELGQRAIALVFSGTGSDGSRGARAVKDAGGTVLVQDEATAVYPDMPRGVIAAGAADQSLPVEKMPEQIMALACPCFAATGLSTRPADLDEMLGAIFRIVKGSTGHDFSNYKVSTVLRRIERRMAATGMTGISGYRDLLEENSGEAHLLCQEMLIGVTSFFRDPDAFELLRARVFPRLFADRAPDDPVRIWHASCSTGEEVYSMAILVREYLDEQRLDCPVQFFATDIDERAIVQARSGLYSPDIEADLGPERLQRFFVASETGYRVAKPLREMIVFAPHSLVKDPPFSRLDLLVCRNFLIYLKSDMQQRLIALFHLALKPGGILFLGSSETVGRSTDLFTPVDAAWKIYERQQGDRKPETPIPIGYAHARLVGTALPHRPAAEDTPPGAMAEKQLLERYSPPCVVVNDKYEVVYVSTRIDRFLEVPVGAPTHDLLKMARKEFRPLLRSAIHKAFDEQKQVVFRGVRYDDADEDGAVNLLVEPLGTAPQARKLAMVVFEPVPGQAHPAPLPDRDDAGAVGDESAKDRLIRQLEEQLFISHEQLQATIEQLESANEGLMSTNEELLSINEEFQSTNEELHSTNEELETSREELQALNEELVTVNAELQQKVEELDQANSDMENLLTSSEIATIFLDRQLRVKRFTPAMAELFHLLPGDTDRPFRHLRGMLDWPGLDQEMESVLAGETPIEREVATRKAARYFLGRLLPYRTSEGSIVGVVLTLIDITERKQLEARTVHLASFPRINPNPVMEIDLQSGINYFNPAITSILESLGLDGQDAAPFLPGDLDRLIETWDRTTETTHYREVAIGDRIFATTVHLAPQFEVVRIYAYDATDRKRAEEKTARQNALLNGINRILEAALDTGTEEDLGGRCLAVAEEITGSRFGFIGEIGEDGLLHDIAVSDPGWDLCAMYDRSGERRPPGNFHIHGVYGRVLLDGQGFFTNDPPSHPDSIGLPAGHPPLKAFLGAPLTRDGSTFGMIAMGNRDGGYSTTELEDLGALSPVIVEAFQRKRSKRALRQSEAKYRQALDTMLEGCQIIGFDWRYLYLNSTAEKHNRRPSTELLGRTVMECWPGFTETRVFALEKSCMEERVVHQLDNEFTFPDGYVGWFRLIIQPVAEGIAIYSEDITERKLAEKAVTETAEHRGLALEAANLGAWDYNFNSGEVLWDDTCRSMFGFTSEDHLPYVEAIARIHPDDRVATDEAVQEALAGAHDGAYHRSFRVVWPDGSVHWIASHGRVYFDDGEQGRPVRFIGVNMDITERKQFIEGQERAARLESLGLLAGGIAHDFNNILTAVIGNISLARTKIGEEHAAARQLASCETALDKATYLTRQLLTFSRGGEPVRGPVDTKQLIREVVTFSLHGSNCKEILDLPPDLWNLDADAGQIHQALNNLIINAVQAMPNGGVLSIGAANEELAAGNPHDLPAGRYVKLVIADQGNGIPPDILPKVFDPYFTTKPNGTGLGLASVFSIVKRHDGAIEVASLPGRGTTFTILLPAVAVSGQGHQARQEMPELPTAPADGTSVLVMDDEEMIRSLAEAMLDKLGYRAVTCGDGAEAVDCYRRALEEGTPFSLVILDMTVPGGMGGKEAAEQIRAIDPGAKLVISTGYAVDSAYQGDNDPMFQGTVSKPYNINKLAQELARLTTRSE